MFARFAAFIRRQHPAFQVWLWVVYGFLRVLEWLADLFGALVRNSSRSFFGGVLRGSAVAVLAKIAGVLIAIGCIFAGLGIESLANLFFLLSAPVIMVLGLAYMISGVFPRRR